MMFLQFLSFWGKTCVSWQFKKFTNLLKREQKRLWHFNKLIIVYYYLN